MDTWTNFDQKGALVLVAHNLFAQLLLWDVLMRLVHLTELASMVQPLWVEGRQGSEADLALVVSDDSVDFLLLRDMQHLRIALVAIV